MSLLNYFTLKQKRKSDKADEHSDQAEQVDNPQPAEKQIRINLQSEDVMSEEQEKCFLKPSELPQRWKSQPLSNFDISLAVGQSLTDAQKADFLLNHFKPESNYKFHPVMQGHLRFPQQRWIEKPHVAFSHVEHGFFCVPCVLFAGETVGKGSHQHCGKFIKSPFRKFKDFLEDWKAHTNSKYHLNAAEAAADFRKCMAEGTSVRKKLSVSHSFQVQRRRTMIKSIMKVIMFCAKSELPFRGHEDSGPLQLNKPGSNEGILREALRLLAKSGDEGALLVLDAPSNATYLSPEIQNEMIECLAKSILRKVVQRIKDAPFFSILADESGLHGHEFLSVCVRFASSNAELREEFLGFVPVFNTSAEQIVDALLDRLRELEIDPSKLVGQGYDGAANMAGKLSGVQKRMRDLFPCADYFHCVSHNLNLALSDAAATLHIIRTMERVRKVLVFFEGSPKRAEILRQQIKNCVPETARTKVAQLSPTRWVQRHETLEAFKLLFPAICKSLEHVSCEERSGNASDLLYGLSSLTSVFSVVVAGKIAGHLKFLAKLLQTPDLDLLKAYEEVDAAKEILTETISDKRNFESLYNEAKAICDRSDISQEALLHENRRGVDIKTFCEQEIYQPYLEALICSIKERFGKRQQVAFTLQYLLPSRCNDLTMASIEDAVHQYAKFLPSHEDVEAEVLRWKAKWRAGGEKAPSNVLVALAETPTLGSCYPNIHALLMILASLPVGTASAERSFSTLGRIFSVGRASMKPKRVSELAICSTYKAELDLLDIDEVVNLFARMTRRKMDFL